ncbi:histidine kinase [Candidatus Scalindua japonica]|uniref:Histidine kinase n=1 Tax=Candidatus Scalindua japonica TaxID=1284222 RepID=A0A286TVZ7_9BACT|nr:response regulator [Candidatus Scalindua japonica]GAX60076.1 histidine kinase [Candidatus Scalindua japonica]
MKGHNQYRSEVEIIKDAQVNITDANTNNDKTLISLLRHEISQLKATNASLNVKLQSLREKHLPHVFLVEDDYDTSQIIAEILHDDYNVIDAGNGIEALSILRKVGNAGSSVKKIDTILLDINLPGMCGFTLCHEVKKKMKLNIPIIVCTARNTKKDVIRAISSGANDYIIKPFQEKTLVSKVNKWTKVNKRLHIKL